MSYALFYKEDKNDNQQPLYFAAIYKIIGFCCQRKQKRFPTFSKNFITDERVSSTLFLALFLAPLITLSLTSVFYGRHIYIFTGMHQANIAAVLVITKEVEDANDTGRQTMAETWIKENLSPIKRKDSFEYFLNRDQDTESLTTNWTPAKVLDKFMNGIFERPMSTEKAISAERFHNPN